MSLGGTHRSVLFTPGAHTTGLCSVGRRPSVRHTKRGGKRKKNGTFHSECVLRHALASGIKPQGHSHGIHAGIVALKADDLRLVFEPELTRARLQQDDGGIWRVVWRTFAAIFSLHRRSRKTLNGERERGRENKKKKRRGREKERRKRACSSSPLMASMLMRRLRAKTPHTYTHTHTLNAEGQGNVLDDRQQGVHHHELQVVVQGEDAVLAVRYGPLQLTSRGTVQGAGGGQASKELHVSANAQTHTKK